MVSQCSVKLLPHFTTPTQWLRQPHSRISLGTNHQAHQARSQTPFKLYHCFPIVSIAATRQSGPVGNQLLHRYHDALVARASRSLSFVSLGVSSLRLGRGSSCHSSLATASLESSQSLILGSLVRCELGIGVICFALGLSFSRSSHHLHWCIEIVMMASNVRASRSPWTGRLNRTIRLAILSQLPS